MFWLLTMLCLMTYGCVMPFNYIATGLSTSTSLRDMPSKEGRKIAGIYMGIPFFIGAIMVPVFWVSLINMEIEHYSVYQVG